MPDQFPRSPRLLKGALIEYQSQFLGPLPNIIAFQYNPEQVRRSLAQRTGRTGERSAGAAREDVLKVKGPPLETITLSVVLDAADQLAEPERNPHVAGAGLHPALAALELLLYPRTEEILQRRVSAKAGTVEIAPPDVPLVLFIWGISRVLPVRLTSFSVTEQAFDQRLNPIQATVELGMEVLTYLDLKEGTVGFNAYTVTQTQKEALARLNLLNTADQVRGLLPF
jgi:hypothetical protein